MEGRDGDREGNGSEDVIGDEVGEEVMEVGKKRGGSIRGGDEEE